MTIYEPKSIFLDPRIEYGKTIKKTVNAEDIPVFIKELKNNVELKIQGKLSRTIFNKIIEAIKNSNVYFSLDFSKTNGLKRIKKRAFYRCSNIYTIILPDSIEEIGQEAFAWAGNLYHCELGTGNCIIRKRVFADCFALTRVDLGNCISIDEEVFYSCSSLQFIIIPKSVQKIGKYAFQNCENLSSHYIADGNQFYSVENGVLYDKNKTILIHYPEKKKNTRFEIPNTVKIIEDSAFENNKYICGVKIPKNVEHIGNYAFSRCESLEGVSIENKDIEINMTVFLGCIYGSMTFKPNEKFLQQYIRWCKDGKNSH